MDSLLRVMDEHSISFDAVVVDEATQCCELELLIALQHGCRLCVLVGDHRQLPPTILSSVAHDGGMGVSLFERLLEAGTPYSMLTTQYRMHPAISAAPNALFYGGQLKDGVGHLTPPPPPSGWVAWPSSWRSRPVALLSVPHGLESSVHRSYQNRAEAKIVARLVVCVLKDAVASGKSAMSTAKGLGVITPYAAQARLLATQLQSEVRGESEVLKAALKQLDIRTVDGFQGREKEMVIISTVRANGKKSVGFLRDSRRANVALTRARRGLVVVGDPNTLSRASTCWAPWVAHARKSGLEAVQPA